MSDTELGSSDGTSSAVDVDRSDITVDLRSVRDRVGRAEDRLATLERDLDRATDREAAKETEFNFERTRRVALELELKTARVEEAQLLLEEASRIREAVLAETQSQAGKIIEEAETLAEQMLAGASDEATAIVAAGRAELDALESEMTRRAAELDSENQRLEQRLAAIQKRQEELRETLQLIADIALEQLSEAQQSVERLRNQARRRAPSNGATAPD